MSRGYARLRIYTCWTSSWTPCTAALPTDALHEALRVRYGPSHFEGSLLVALAVYRANDDLSDDLAHDILL